VLHYDVHSRLVGRTLPQLAIKPADAAARPPLLVFLHGRGQHPEVLAGDGIYAALAGLGRRAPAVVLPDGGFQSYWHDRAGGRWGSYVLDEVIPAAVRRLHADPNRVAIGGISMGGFGAYDLAARAPGRFCAVGGHSAAIFPSAGVTAPGAFDDAEDFARNDVLATARSRGPSAFGDVPHWIDDGTLDPFHAADTEMAADLGIHMHSWPGRHDTDYWSAHFDDYLRFYARALARC
jgi:S-formylglutathione hydrolase FrmB